MPLDGISSSAKQSTAAAGTPNASGSKSVEPKSNMDKEAFLKLLLAQLKAQDPLKPMEGSEFVAQLATFSQVEQAIMQSQKLERISLQLTGLASNEAVSLIGKDVTVRAKLIAFDGTNPTGFSVNLGSDATKTDVTILDQAGKPVRTMKMGAQKVGPLSVPWDGRNDAGGKVAPGSYTVQVKAEDAAGKAIDVSSDVRGRVVSVSFAKGYPEIILDSGARAPISDLISVSGQPAAKVPLAASSPLAGSSKLATQNSLSQLVEGLSSLSFATKP